MSWEEAYREFYNTYIGDKPGDELTLEELHNDTMRQLKGLTELIQELYDTFSDEK